MAFYAADYETYPVVVTTTEATNTLAVDSLDGINTSAPSSKWTNNNSVFPLDSLSCSSKVYISAHACVLLDEFEEEGEGGVSGDSAADSDAEVTDWLWQWGDK